MNKTQLAHFLIDIDAAIFNPQVEVWREQANSQRVYINFEPSSKLVTIQKWGACRRPSNTLESLWLGLDLTKNKSLIQAEIITSLTKWDKVYGDIHFSLADSEPLPALLPFSKGTIPIKTPEKLFLANAR